MKRRLLFLLCTCALLALIGCAGGSSALSVANFTHPPAAPETVAPDTSGQSQRNTLSISMPALAGLQPGAEFDVVLSAHFQSGLYQGCGRLAYDSQVVRPLSAKRGIIPASDVFVVKLDAPAESGTARPMDGIVPFAFTGLPAGSGAITAAGELLRVRFKLLTAPGAAYPVSLINVPEYLQLRGTQGQRLSFDLNTEVVSK